MSDEWILIKKNKKLKITKQEMSTKQEISNNNIINIIINTLSIYKPKYIFLYGSRARNTHKDNSDVDLMVFWNHQHPTIEKIIELKEKLRNALNLNVDFVNMIITNKKNMVYDERTLCYYDNVSRDAILIYYDTKQENISDLLDVSCRIKT